MRKDLLYVIEKNHHDEASLKAILKNHCEIKFVSLAGVDLVGHETEAKIPVHSFIADMDTFLNGIAVQTDGSSVYLPNIATLDNAKIDMKADVDRKWFIDYNYENIDEGTGHPVGTLKIPCYLFHDGEAVDSRHILLNAVDLFKRKVTAIIKEGNSFKKNFGFEGEDIEEIIITAATELEFWVMTPNDARDITELSTSQELHEQYWAATRGAVRTALEQTLEHMKKYDLEPEMGHKEVGGVKARLNGDGSLSGIMEQLEIDWKYTTALQSADNEIMVKKIIKEVFRKNGMDVTFLAKPIPGIAGSGEHVHIGVAARLKSGKTVNLFNSNKDGFLSILGYGALMGILKNYEVINPFITSSNEAFKRLKKGFEAPICTVTSLGRNPETPSRNRTVLVGLIRDEKNPMATRFELRSPNPHTNTYLCLTTMLLSMLDGIEYALLKDKSEKQLLDEISKKSGDRTDYLEESRCYRSEKDVFDDYTDEEREAYFGFVPSTVYENIKSLETYPDKTMILTKGQVLTEKILNSFKSASLDKWVTEIEHRMIPDLYEVILETKMIHNPLNASDLDISYWNRINNIRNEIAKDNHDRKSLFTKIKEAIDVNDYERISDLQKLIYSKIEELRELHNTYKNNMID